MKCYKCGTILEKHEKCPSCGIKFWEEPVSFLFPLKKAEKEQYSIQKSADIHSFGQGVEENKEQTAYLYTEALADSEYADIIRKYFTSHMSASGMGCNDIIGIMVEKSYFMNKARENNAMAWYQLACDEKNEKKETELYRKAHECFLRDAKQGYVEAYEMLGEMYQYGRGVEKDEKQAAEWYQKALSGWTKGAGEGNAAAQRRLGDMYYEGKGTAKNIEQAISWYQKSARQKDVKALRDLGWIYYEGKGVSKNITKGIRWYKMAAVHGDVVAQGRLGSMYLYGFDVAVDYKQAAKWYVMAANNGNKWAMRELSYFRSKSE